LIGEETGVMMMRLPSRVNCTSVPGNTPAASRIGLGMVTWPLSVTSAAWLPEQPTRQESGVGIVSPSAWAGQIGLA
jgi:hypothetical protein